MCPTLPCVETPAPLPGSAGPRPASAPLTLHGGGNAGRRQDAEPAPDSGDAPAPESTPPDSTAPPALDTPDTTGRGLLWPGTISQASHLGWAPGGAAPLRRGARSPAQSASKLSRSCSSGIRWYRALRGPPSDT